MDIADVRAAPAAPHPLFQAWLTEARQHPEIQYAHAMCLSTLSPDGFPEGRIVLLHRADEGGFYFITDRRSAKGTALAHLPRAALTFYWGPLERQVRVQGAVAPASEALADAFFGERPRRSQVTAWASLQSRVLASRAALEQRMARYDEAFADTEELTRPPHWTAYRLEPRRVEFWQARARRLHDRLLYTRTEDGGWEKSLLYP